MMLFLGKAFSTVMEAMRWRLSVPTPLKIDTRCKKAMLLALFIVSPFVGKDLPCDVYMFTNAL
jgi:hypothetical protein